MHRILCCILSTFLLCTVFISAQDSPSASTAPDKPSDEVLLSKFTITMQTSLKGTLGTALSDKSIFIKALKSSGMIQDVSNFLSGTNVTVVSYADDADNVSIMLLDSGLKTNLLVKNTAPNMLDYIDTRQVFAYIGPVLNLYANYIKIDTAANIPINQYFGLTRKGQSCIFSFVDGGYLGPITLFIGDMPYQIEGEFARPGILYIPAPVDKLTGKKRTSSLIYSFFE